MIILQVLSMVLYGINEETNMDVHDPNDTSKLRLGSRIIINQESIHLEFDRDNNIEITAFNRNWWLGLSRMHTLFSLEHNAVVDGLYQTYSDLYTSDERYGIAGLAVSVSIAKIHTSEWTRALLNSDVCIETIVNHQKVVIELDFKILSNFKRICSYL